MTSANNMSTQEKAWPSHLSFPEIVAMALGGYNEIYSTWLTLYSYPKSGSEEYQWITAENLGCTDDHDTNDALTFLLKSGLIETMFRNRNAVRVTNFNRSYRLVANWIEVMRPLFWNSGVNLEDAPLQVIDMRKHSTFVLIKKGGQEVQVSFGNPNEEGHWPRISHFTTGQHTLTETMNLVACLTKGISIAKGEA